MSELPLSDRVAVVTGGASGIGRATARELARLGAVVYVGDVNLATDNVLEKEGIVQRECDVRMESDVAGLVDMAVAPSGRLDILVNNAGIGMVKPITDVSAEEWHQCIDTNLTGPFFGCKHAIPYMRAQGGSIINVASNAGILPRAHDPVYSTSKIALIGLTRSLALCHSIDRIRVNAVCPGPVGDTGMMNADLDAAEDRQATAQSFIDASPLARANSRMISPTEVAQAIAYFASDASAMVTGTSLTIDGGKSLGVPPR